MELTEALKVLRTEHQRLSAENERLRTILAQYPETLMQFAGAARELSQLVPVLQLFMETQQVRQRVQEYTIPTPDDPEAWRYGYAPPPGPEFGPGSPPGAVYAPAPPAPEGEPGVSLPEEPEWDEEGR